MALVTAALSGCLRVRKKPAFTTYNSLKDLEKYTHVQCTCSTSQCQQLTTIYTFKYTCIYKHSGLVGIVHVISIHYCTLYIVHVHVLYMCGWQRHNLHMDVFSFHHHSPAGHR